MRGFPLVHPSRQRLVLGQVWGPADVNSGLFRCTAVAGEVPFLSTVVAGSPGAALLLLPVLSRIDSLVPLSRGPAPTQVHWDRSVVITWWSGTGVEPRLLTEVLLLALWLGVPWLLGPINVWPCRGFCVDQGVDQDSGTHGFYGFLFKSVVGNRDWQP